MRQAMQRKYMELRTDAGGVVDWGFVANFKRTADEAVASSATDVLAATALTNATQTINTGITSPPSPRNIQVLGNAAGIAGNVVITGTAYDGSTITETIALNGTVAVEGSKAFLTVTQIEFPAYTNGATDTVSVGFGDRLGLPFKLSLNTVLSAHLNGVKETTAPTLTTHATNIENNTIKLNSALNGTAVNVFLIV